MSQQGIDCYANAYASAVPTKYPGEYWLSFFLFIIQPLVIILMWSDISECNKDPQSADCRYVLALAMREVIWNIQHLTFLALLKWFDAIMISGSCWMSRQAHWSGEKFDELMKQIWINTFLWVLPKGFDHINHLGGISKIPWD